MTPNMEGTVNNVETFGSQTEQPAKEQNAQAQVKVERKQREKAPRKAKQEEQTLDTSQLLKKKDDRNTM